MATRFLENESNPFTGIPDEMVWPNDLADIPADTLSMSIGHETKSLDLLSKFRRLNQLCTTLSSDQLIGYVEVMKSLRHLRISRCEQVISDLGNLPTLKILVFFRCTKLTSLDLAVACPDLRSLAIWGCLKLENLDGLRFVPKLEEFSITGSMSKTPKLDSLEPFIHVPNLRWLSLATMVRDKSLLPLCNLKNLQYLWTANRFKREQYEKVLSECPKLKQIDLHNGTYDRANGFVKDPN